MENVTEYNTIKVLNSLVIINNDRIEGYKTASNETREIDLKTLFFDFIKTSEHCRKELIAEVINPITNPKSMSVLFFKRVSN